MIGDDWIADVEGAKAFGLEAVFFDVFNDDFDADNIFIIKKLEEIRNIL